MTPESACDDGHERMQLAGVSAGACRRATETARASVPGGSATGPLTKAGDSLLALTY